MRWRETERARKREGIGKERNDGGESSKVEGEKSVSFVVERGEGGGEGEGAICSLKGRA